MQQSKLFRSIYGLCAFQATDGQKADRLIDTEMGGAGAEQECAWQQWERILLCQLRKTVFF